MKCRFSFNVDGCVLLSRFTPHLSQGIHLRLPVSKQQVTACRYSPPDTQYVTFKLCNYWKPLNKLEITRFPSKMPAPRVLRSQFCRRRWNSIPWGIEAVLNRCLSRSKEVKLPVPLMQNSWEKIYSIAPTELPAIFSPFHPMILINPLWSSFFKKSVNTDLISKMHLIGWMPSPLGLSFPLIGWNLFPWDPIFSQVTCQALPGM